MAGYCGDFIIEWRCLLPEVYNEEHGYMEWCGNCEHDVTEKFLERNPDYEVISVKAKKD